MSFEKTTDTNKGKALHELQGLHVTMLTGSTANANYDIAPIRDTDTLVAAIVNTYAAGAVDTHADDLANMKINSCKAKQILTVGGTPLNGDVFTVKGVTYTFKTTPTGPKDILRTGTVTAVAERIVAAVNQQEGGFDGTGFRKPVLIASNLAGVVTFTATQDGLGNAPIATDTGSTITVSSTDVDAVTATFVSAGDTDALTVNGVTFTIKTIPVDAMLDMAILADDTLQAAEMARAINFYDDTNGTLDVVASSALGVVTLKPRSAFKGNAIKITETATNVTVGGAALAGGTLTGSVTSTTDLSAKTVQLFWFKK